MNVGDRRTIGGKTVEILSVEPDANGAVAIVLLDGDDRYYSAVHPDQFDPEPPTYRADTPHGQVTINLPVDGNPVQQAKWSQAATDAATTP